MCRFLFYAGTPVLLDDLLFQPKYSLIQQSIHAREREEPLNGDGFGIGWWMPGEPTPGQFRSISPAWSNENLQSMCRVIRSARVMAHVRAASVGLSVYEGNCHPFVSGKLALMHNGDVAGFPEMRRKLLGTLSDRAFATLRGHTDSEFLFALVQDVLWEMPRTANTLEDMAQALTVALQRVVALTDLPGGPKSYFNVVLSSGAEAVACRAATTDDPDLAESLHVHTGGVYRVVAGVCRMVAPTDSRGAVIISSEELSDDPGWRKVPPNHLLTVAADGQVNMRPLPLR